MTEPERKRSAALEAAGPFATSDDVRWLLCGRGRPVSAGSSPYVVDLAEGHARVWYQDIERSRIDADERWQELGYAPSPYPWYEPPPVCTTNARLQALRLALTPEEQARYRLAGTEAAAAFVGALEALKPDLSEYDAVGELADRLQSRGFTTPVLLAGGEARAPVHRHPLPTQARLGRFALLAVTAERDGLYLSMTRIVTFGRVPTELARVARAAATVDARVLAESRPGRTLGELFTVLSRTYEEQGFPGEWRRHHQGGLTGYAGREVFATPENGTRLPNVCAVAWNPSVSGGGKSEDTALVSDAGVDVITRTPTLPEIEPPIGPLRPGIVEL